MKTVWKYQYNIREVGDGPLEVEIPQTHKIVMVGPEPSNPRDNSIVCFWVVCDSEAPKEKAKFIVVGTGHPLPGNAQYIGSVVIDPFAWHLFKLL